MCLNKVTTKEPLIAEKDIVCYKVLKKVFRLKPHVLNKSECIMTMHDGTIIKGAVFFLEHYQWVCHNDPNFFGSYSTNFLEFKYTWRIDHFVKEVMVNGENVLEVSYKTLYLSFPVKLGETYTSKLEKRFSTVEVGLHSYKEKLSLKNNKFVVVECIIPKGSNYYCGEHFSMLGSLSSYASDTLKYLTLSKK